MTAEAIAGSVYDAFVSAAQRYAQQPFLCVVADTAKNYDIEAREYTYAEALSEVQRLRATYRAAGYGCGQRAGLLLENRPTFFFHWFALNALGVSVVPINADFRASELDYLVEHSEICIAVALPEKVDMLRQAAQRVGSSLQVISADQEGALAAPPTPAASGAAPDADTECALLYTSGTTGKPKGCVLSNEYYLWAGQWYATLGGLCEVRRGVERLITPLPLTHMNAMACSTMAMITTGGCIVQLDRFHPQTWWRSVRESRASIVHYLGVMPAMLLAAPPTAQDREHQVRFGFGAGVERRHHAVFEQRFGFPLVEAWAMTETGCGAVIAANHEPRKVGSACFGKPQSFLEYRLVNQENCDIRDGTPGELLVRGKGDRPRFGFFSHYLKDPEATAEAWAGGYFHTGDVVQVDADGDLHFVDRKKNVIRRSGENISALEVESVLLQHPNVAAVGVAAVPDALRGDEVMACIVTKTEQASAPAFARELVAFCLERLAYYKAPGYVALCAALPLTATQKIQRGELKAFAETLLAAAVDTRAMKKRA